MQVVQDKCIEKRGFGAWPTDENFFFLGPCLGLWERPGRNGGCVACKEFYCRPL